MLIEQNSPFWGSGFLNDPKARLKNRTTGYISFRITLLLTDTTCC